ncbi:MAG: 2-hydroxyacid dehydrogenase [Geminicoccaceae bacterium]|jgi:D-3-phosphoglycerate dehydrogenase|nr:2-hydroxyacid dehydrogenase [Geminicoccaceae bacterium]MCB9968452.1 2-hydroxyacid dehydrogenase [Geminicoccaceae bacterium]HRY25785.1 2-hydroxyacid dehydrogenase [Geminicoccaceae bacterium]
MTRVSIIGDRFMAPEVFEAALPKAGLDCRLHQLAWPDEPFVNACETGELAGLKEFMGEPGQIASMIGDAEVLVTHLAPVSASILERCPSLRLIGVSRGGPVNIDRAACAARAVQVVNAPGRNASAVAEFTIGAILMETRLMRAGHEALRQGIWRGDLYRADLTGPELSELTVGLIGYGQIGTRVVKLLRPFGCRILVADPYKTLDADDAAHGVVMTDLADLLARSDVVSLHARVTDETRGFLAAPEFAAMQRGAWFINTARGPMVNYPDLCAALESGHLRGAMLETFWQEPPPADSPLLRLPNVTLTPHIAGASTTTVRIAAAMVAEEIRRWRAGEPFLNPC